MRGLGRFFPMYQENSIFKFVIDTRIIVSGATNGSQNPLTFKLPIYSTATTTNCILKVSDGRTDVVINESNVNNNAVTLLTFATAGIYTITIIGSLGAFHPTNGTVGYDIRKIISVEIWGKDVKYITFNGCINCEFNATNTLYLPASSAGFFASTKGFPNQDLSNIQVRDVATAPNILQGVPTKFKKLFNPFWNNLTTAASLYSGLDFSELEFLEIRSNTLTSVQDIFSGTRRAFVGQIILETPNLTNISALCYRFNNPPPALDKCDVRNVTNTLNWLLSGQPMPTSRVDATLLAWAQLPFMQSGVTWNWVGSKYSNNAAVIAAYNKITITWGVVFTNLTMA